MRRRLKTVNERFTIDDGNELQTLVDQRLLRMLRYLLPETAGATQAPSAAGGFYGDGALAVYTGGTPVAGMTFDITEGFGFWFNSAATAEEADWQPVYSDVDQAVNIDAEPAGNDRIDAIYVKSLEVDEDNATRDFVDPVSPHGISQSGTDTTRRWDRQFVVAKGTPHPTTPVAPADPIGYGAENKICEIYVTGGAGAFNPATELTDTRLKIAPDVGDIMAELIGYNGLKTATVNAKIALDDLEGMLTITGSMSNGALILQLPSSGPAVGGYALAWRDITNADDDDNFTLPVTYNATGDYSAMITANFDGGDQIGVQKINTKTVKVKLNGNNNRDVTIWTFGELA